MLSLILLVSTVTLFLSETTAFQPTIIAARAPPQHGVTASSRLADASTSPDDSSDEATSTLKMEAFLKQKFPSFYSLLSKNDDILKTLSKSNGYTLFAPNEQAFENLGDKRTKQLADDRNYETAQKMALYHVVVLDTLTATALRTEDWTGPKPADGSPRPFTVGGILTLGGEVPVGRSKSGGFLGIGAKEDGDAVIGPNARILKSYAFEGDGEEAIVHEVDALISPEILWRYCDQLRIPGF